MSIVLKIAWRNLWRKPRRTLLTVITISLGLALLLIFLGLGDGGHEQMIESAVRMGSGHVLVQQKGYQAQGGISRLVSLEEMRAVEIVLHTAPVGQLTRYLSRGFFFSFKFD